MFINDVMSELQASIMLVQLATPETLKKMTRN